MSARELLMKKFETLLPEDQQKVVEFVEFLEYSRKSNQKPGNIKQKVVSPLGERLQKIRDKIVASGQPLLTSEEADREKAERRGGYQGE